MGGTTLALRFPWGKVHATPWDRNVNEAAVEWPLSPWRLLRALYATWQTRVPGLDAADVAEVLSVLAQPPSFLLPPATEAHTRHYLPDRTSGPPARDSKTKPYTLRRTDKVIDAFVVTERDAEVWCRWDIDLSERHRSLLGALAAAVPYLGRAESLCQARLVSDESPPPTLRGQGWLVPAEEGRQGDFRLLAPRRPLQLDALTVTTERMRAAGLLMPAGACWQPYVGKIQLNSDVVRTASRAPRRSASPTAVRWAISATAKPSLRAAVVMADVLRQAAQKWYGDVADGGASTTLAGKDKAGKPLSGHGHAHYLALDSDNDRLLDTLVLWAPQGLTTLELSALVQIPGLFGRERVAGFRPCNLGLEAVGAVEVVAPEIARRSIAWTSHTPFAPTRHQKRKQDMEKFIEDQVRLEIDRRPGLPQPNAIEILPPSDTPFPALAFNRRRAREGPESGRRAHMLRISFAEEVSGPLSLGALNHFGLGLFTPTDVGIA